MRGWIVGWCLVLGVIAGTRAGWAQEMPGIGLTAEVSRAIPQLRRTISLKLEGASMDDALRAVARQSELPITYNDAILPPGRKVWLSADEIRTDRALEKILEDSGLRLLALSSGQVVVVKSRATPTPPRVEGGTIVGVVTDANTGEEIGSADVRLEGTRWRASTMADGRYRLTDIAPGSYTLVVRRIGYAQRTQPVTVVADQETTADVALTPVPTRLDEVVTTVTGEQRLRELGHVVGRINADSLVREAPVSNVTELLNARVPGVQVFTGQGTVGGDAAIRVRGATTFILGQEPIVIVDGVRYMSGRNDEGGNVVQHEPTSRLNDLNPNDIESIEVVKGPSAATLYGTDAVNGVIVITTKRGRPGPARWNAYARTSMSEIPVEHFPGGVRGWSGSTENCTLALIAEGSCTQDSITTVVNPLNDPDLTIFGNAPRWEYGANVSGGNSGVRYYVSVDIEEATGPLKMPTALVEQLETLREVAALPEEQLEPNAFTKLNLRSNVTLDLSERVDLEASAGYTQNATRTIRTTSPYSSGAFEGTPDNPYGTDYTPDRIFSAMSTERVNRFTGSARVNLRPWTWLAMWGSAGLDLTSTTRSSLSRPGQGPPGMTSGSVGDKRLRDVLTTANFGTRASFQFDWLSSRTAVGVQYVRVHEDELEGRGSGLPPGGETISGAEYRYVYQDFEETATLGGYVEQMFGLNERLYLTGAARADGATTFGRDYSAAIYPKASVSWIVSEEPFMPRLPGLGELRLRYAYGASGRQPETYMALPGYTRGTALVEGAERQSIRQYGLGNPDLRPERTREHEFGFDAELLAGRLRLEGTWYRRTTIDGIQLMSLQPGYGSIRVNIGRVDDRGFEGQLWVRPIDTRAISWDIALQHSSNTNELIDIGGARTRYELRGGLVEGYPIGARFMTPLLGYEDANGNGIIEQSEVTLGDTAVYAGRNTPAQTQTLNTVVGLFGQRLRISGLFDRRAGYTQYDNFGHRRCSTGYCRAAVDPATPLDIQAQVAALGSYPTGTAYTFMDEGTFIRLREVAVAFDVPESWVRAVRLRHATLGLSVRNLAMWSSFRGIDVESVVGAGWWAYGGGRPNGIPQARSWVLRLDVGF